MSSRLDGNKGYPHWEGYEYHFFFVSPRRTEICKRPAERYRVRGMRLKKADRRVYVTAEITHNRSPAQICLGGGKGPTNHVSRQSDFPLALGSSQIGHMDTGLIRRQEAGKKKRKQPPGCVSWMTWRLLCVWPRAAVCLMLSGLAGEAHAGLSQKKSWV